MQGQKDIQELIGFLFAQIDELKQVIEVLKFENEELKSKLADYQTKKNSNNSSKPPSSDYRNHRKKAVSFEAAFLLSSISQFHK